MEDFFSIHVTIENIYFSDHNTVGDIIEKDADFHTVSESPI